MTRTWAPKAIVAIGLFGLALAIRLEQHHSALLYPDGYQYLLMARGISEHLEPTTVLGHGGELFVPNADAAIKPLFPLAVAVVHFFGVGWLSAAEIVTTLASAAVVALTFLLASRLGGTWLAGAVAALVLLASPTLAFWSGFSGPDALAQALGLGAALAFVYQRPRLGGVLLALAAATRPELFLVALCAFVVCMAAFPHRRRDATRGALAFVLTIAVVFVALRPPVALPDRELLWIPVVLALLCLAGALMPVNRLAMGIVAGALIAVVVVGFASASGLAGVWHRDWPLIAAALVGLGIAAFDPDRRRAGLGIFAVAVLLGAVYWVKNPGLERYFAILLPLAALLVGIGAAGLVQRWRWSLVPVAAAVVAVVAIGFVGTSVGNYDQDVFSRTAQKLEPLLTPTDPLVTAAPDAYGFWLPNQPVRTMRPGTHGFVLLDPAQRSYAPDLAASGKVIARVDSEIAFSRPDGEIDAGRAVLVAGHVTRDRERPAASRSSSSTKPSRSRSTATIRTDTGPSALRLAE